MKAEELMLGDYVRDKYGHFVKVKEIYSDSIFTEDSEYEGEQLFEGEFEPIPLTPEILEKNGFLQNGIGSDEIEILDPDYSDETYVWQERDEYDNLFTVSVYNLNDGIGNWSLEIVDSPKGKMELEIKYVHELQRALRICGIEKEVEL